MTQFEFERLFYSEKLLHLEHHCPKVANFLTWTDPLKSITVYAVDTFYAELVFDFESKKIEAINAFENVDYLAKYRDFMSVVEAELRVLKNDHNSFTNL